MDKNKRSINVGVIGTGCCGGARGETCSRSPFVNDLHIAEIMSNARSRRAGSVIGSWEATDAPYSASFSPSHSRSTDSGPCSAFLP